MSADELDIHMDGCGVDAAPYVLGALPDEELATFSAHLSTCAVCREEVAAMGAVVAVLPQAAAQVSAPVELKRTILSTVQREASLHGQPIPSASAAPSTPAARRRFGWSPALAGGSLLAAVVAIAIALSSGGGGGSSRTIRAEVLVSRASATVQVSDGHAVLNIAGMPQATPGRVYEVWILRTGAPQPTDALFTVNRVGSATVGVPGALKGVKEILVTSEPRGGSPAPTRTPVIVAKVS